MPPSENTPDRPSTACFFQVLTWVGCSLCFAAISWIVRSLGSASSPTLALNWSENFRHLVILVFLLHVGIHLNRLSEFAGPLQDCRYRESETSSNLSDSAGHGAIELLCHQSLCHPQRSKLRCFPACGRLNSSTVRARPGKSLRRSDRYVSS